MPAVSKDQATAMAIAEHAPGKLFKRNRGLLKMSKKQLSDYASTARKGLPKTVGENMPSLHNAARSAMLKAS